MTDPWQPISDWLQSGWQHLRGERVHLGVFGKHPSQSGHLGLGMDGLLSILENTVYREGIGSAVTSGVWKDLSDAERLPAFSHLIVCCVAQDVVVGRLWDSRDAVGRTEFPMGVGVCCSGVPLRAVLEKVVPLLGRVERSARESATIGEVQAVVAVERQRLRAWSRHLAPGESPGAKYDALASAESGKSDSPEDWAAVGLSNEGLLRVLSQVEGAVPQLARSGATERAGGVAPASHHVRVPRRGESAEQGLLKWATFFEHLLQSPGCPLLIMVPLEGDWLDVVVGRPEPRHFHLLKFTLAKEPLTSDTPYPYAGDPEFVTRVGWVLCTHHPFGDTLERVGAEHPPYTPKPVGPQAVPAASAETGARPMPESAPEEAAPPAAAAAAASGVAPQEVTPEAGRPPETRPPAEAKPAAPVAEPAPAPPAPVAALPEPVASSPAAPKAAELCRVGAPHPPSLVEQVGAKHPPYATRARGARRRRNPPRMILLAVVGLAVLGGAGLALKGFLGGGGDSQSPPKGWEALVGEYKTWVLPLRDAVDKTSNPARYEAWSRDEYLARHVLKGLQELAALPGLAGDPTPKPATLVEGRWESLPEDVRRRLHASGAEVGQALAQTRDLRVAISNWPDLRLMMSAVEAWQTRQWTRRAGHLKGLARQCTASPRLAEAVDEVSRLAPVVRGIEKGYERLAASRDAIRAAAEARGTLLGRFDEFTLAETGEKETADTKADLERLQDRLTRLTLAAPGREGLAEQLAAFVRGAWADRVDRSYVSERPPQPLPSGRAPTEADFELWLKSVAAPDGDYRLMPFPADASLAKSIADIMHGLDEADGDLRGVSDGGVSPPAGQPLEARLRGLRDRAKGLDDNLLAMKGKPWSRGRWRDAGEPAVAKIAVQAKALAGEVQKLRADLDDRSAAAAQKLRESLKAEELPVASEALKAAWRRHRDELVKREMRLSPLRARAEQLRGLLGAVEKQFAGASKPNLPPKGEWGPVLARRLAAERERAIGTALARWEGRLDYAAIPPPGEGLATFAKEAAAGPRSEWENYLNNIDRLAAKVGELEDALSRGRQKDIERLEPDVKQEVLLRDPEVRKALDPVMSRAGSWLASGQALQAIRAETDPRKLVAQVRAAADGRRADVALAAWRRLGELGWPRTRQEMAQEWELARSLEPLVRGDAAQASQFARERRERWERYFGRVPKEDIKDALDSCIDLQLRDPPRDWRNLGATDVSKLSDPRAQYNVIRYWLERALAEISDTDPEVASKADAIRRQFVTYVQTRLTTVYQEAAIKGFVDRLAGITAAGQAGTSPLEAGPALAGSEKTGQWTRSASSGAQAVTYSWTLELMSGEKRRHDLEFRYLPEKGCYLCTHEVSVGLLVDWIRACGSAGMDLKKLGERGMFDGTQHGPRAWKFDPIPRQEAENWLQFPPRVGEAGWYFTKSGDVPPGDPGNERPSREHPMNFISPSAALMVARLLKCRLPTSAEWNAAYAKEPLKTDWNLRDKTWLKQRDYLKNLAASGRGYIALWPDAGIFVPEGVRVKRKDEAEVAAGEALDGLLWFARVDTDVDSSKGHIFKHLIGNVAELACEDVAAQDGLPAGEPPPEALQGAFRVIGGSALSPPQVKNTQAYPVTRGGACSDVGFRLAFTATAPPASLRAELCKCLENAGGYATIRADSRSD